MISKNANKIKKIFSIFLNFFALLCIIMHFYNNTDKTAAHMFY